MEIVPLKLVTVIAEALLEDQLIADIKRLGARGYSRGEVYGEGSRGLRASEWEGKNVRIETLVGEATATRILEHLAATYFADYAMVAYVADVGVVRGEKYV
jgi:nitrogen regulatory protein P-II 2